MALVVCALLVCTTSVAFAQSATEEAPNDASQVAQATDDSDDSGGGFFGSLRNLFGGDDEPEETPDENEDDETTPPAPAGTPSTGSGSNAQPSGSQPSSNATPAGATQGNVDVMTWEGISTPAPVVLDIDNAGMALIRGTVTNVGTNAITIETWGGQWTLTTNSTTSVIPWVAGHVGDISGISVGDFVGARGVALRGESTLRATLVRNWSTHPYPMSGSVAAKRMTAAPMTDTDDVEIETELDIDDIRNLLEDGTTEMDDDDEMKEMMEDDDADEEDDTEDADEMEEMTERSPTDDIEIETDLNIDEIRALLELIGSDDEDEEDTDEEEAEEEEEERIETWIGEVDDIDDAAFTISLPRSTNLVVMTVTTEILDDDGDMVRLVDFDDVFVDNDDVKVTGVMDDDDIIRATKVELLD